MDSAADSAPERCARCGGPFHCGFGDTQPCWCTVATLDAPARAELARRYSGCLCSHCLAAWRADGATKPARA